MPSGLSGEICGGAVGVRGERRVWRQLRDGLGERLAGPLAAVEVSFRFGIDIQADEDRHPIEDPRICWSEAGARREWLARIGSSARRSTATCCSLRACQFLHGHALKAHEPLGRYATGRAVRSIARWRVPPPPQPDCPGRKLGRSTELQANAGAGLGRPILGAAARAARSAGEAGEGVRGVGGQSGRTVASLVRLIEKVPWLRQRINRRVINRIACKTAQRPLPMSLRTADDKPVDPKSKETYGTCCLAGPRRPLLHRRAPAADGGAEVASLPDVDRVAALFAQRTSGGKPSPTPAPCSASSPNG